MNKHFFKQLLICVALLLLAGKLRAQNAEMAGIVKDEKGLPLAGVSIELSDVLTQQIKSTLTADDGKFKLQQLLSQTPYDLSISCIGYQTKRLSKLILKPSEHSSVIIELLPLAAKSLEEVMVIGYGTQSKTSITGAVGKVSFSQIKDQPVTNFDQAIIGRIAGVQVLQSSGEPGKGSTFRIRGTGSITAGNGPLVVVDGYPLDSQGQANEFVNTNDIESVEVLKDASSAAIYGSRGANGVILITTKKARQENCE
ncbi:TonB-dependent receptor plug domain-containing protein [Pedobacter sp. P26]|uniref:TonB-dependent receptor plug domain-containing protein n=1 Tax=Pedobacter sp. P26 TaxID=3423956 RepID=UPI003D665003